jgi:hypothetical protein
MNLTFGKFEGSLADEGGKSVYVDGVEVGFIERDILWKEPTVGMGAYTNPKVVGYRFSVFEGGEAATFSALLLPLDGRDFATLGECQRAIKAALGLRTRP